MIKKIASICGHAFARCMKFYLFSMLPAVWFWFPVLFIAGLFDKRGKYFGKVFVECWDGEKWGLSAVEWWQYLLMRLWGYCGDENADIRFYDYRHVPRKKIALTL
jgi:hypothetical protein